MAHHNKKWFNSYKNQSLTNEFHAINNESSKGGVEVVARDIVEVVLEALNREIKLDQTTSRLTA